MSGFMSAFANDVRSYPAIYRADNDAGHDTHPPYGGVMSGMSVAVQHFYGGAGRHEVRIAPCGNRVPRARRWCYPVPALPALVVLASIGGHCCAAFAWPFIDIIGLFCVFAYKVHYVKSCCTAAWQANPLILLGCAATSISISFSKNSSTGWVGYCYQPPVQMGQPYNIMRFSHASYYILTVFHFGRTFLADFQGFGAICPQHHQNSAVSWPQRPTTPNLLRKLAYRPR